MMRIDPARSALLAAALASLTLAPGRAQAQFGGGYGYGLYNFNYQPPEIGYLNQRSLANGARATGPVQNNVYANNPNSYVNHLHDQGFQFQERYDVESRRASEDRYLYRPSTMPTTPTPSPSSAPTASRPAPPMVPLSSFFDRDGKLIWPDEAPAAGDLGKSRQAADRACLAALNDYNLRGLAELSTVTEARARVIDYGRPALQSIRATATPRIADTFHMFLLELYESLAQAATVPKPAPPATSPAAPGVPPRP